MKRLKAQRRKLVPLRGENTTPTIVLARSLDKAPRMKGVALVILWDDDTYDLDWSTMKNSEFVMAALLLEEEARSTVRRCENKQEYHT